MYLTIDSFGAFLTSTDNTALIEEGKFEFILWDSSEKKWVLKQLESEDEMDDYLHSGPILSDTQQAALIKANPTYPICILEEDVYTNNVPHDPDNIIDSEE